MRTSFEEQLKPVFDDALRYARALAGSGVDGDDLLQESLVRALRGYHRLRDTAKFKNWLFRIVTNTNRSLVRKRTLLNWIHLGAAADIEAGVAMSFEEKDAVRQILQRLPLPQREALVLFEVTGLRIEEIAELQKVSVSAVKSRLARGREKLRESYLRLEVEYGTSGI
jgi:RNA polymerase sigma-70 factor (ECF subfamily)